MKLSNMRIRKRIEIEKKILSDIGGGYMLKFLTCEVSKSYKTKKPETEQSKFKYKYAQLKRFYHDL